MERGAVSKAWAAAIYLLFAVFFIWGQGQRGYAAHLILEWDPPDSRIDGSPLTEPTGYRVYYGKFSKTYQHVVETGQTNYTTIDGLDEETTYYFVVTARDESGLESPPSEEIAWNSLFADYPTLNDWMAQYHVTNRLEEVIGTDLDGDGYTTWDEYIMGSDPTDPNCHLRVSSMTPMYFPVGLYSTWTNDVPPYEVVTQVVYTVGGFVVRWECFPDRVYDIQYSTGLEGEAWAPMPGMTGLVPSSGELAVTNWFEGEETKMLRLVVQHP